MWSRLRRPVPAAERSQNDDIDLLDVVGEGDALGQAYRLTPIGFEHTALIHSTSPGEEDRLR